MKYLVFLLTIFLCACSAGKGGTTGGNPLSEDTSASGAVAGALGGALSSSNSAGAQAYFQRTSPPMFASVKPMSLSLLPQAKAAGLCPTFHSAQGAECTASGDTMWLTYSDCSYGQSSTEWHGVLARIMSTGTASCGTFPYPGASETLYQQYVSGAGSTTPSSLVLTSGYGTVVAIDDHTANLANFDSVSITALVNGGYGSSVSFAANGTRDSITIAHRIRTIGGFDQSVTGNLTIHEILSTSSRTVTGNVTVYYNNLQVIGTSTVNITHSDTCCLPVSGTIETAFSSGTASPIGIGNLMTNKSEKLTFTGCGTATLTAYDGSAKQVSLTRCY